MAVLAGSAIYRGRRARLLGVGGATGAVRARVGGPIFAGSYGASGAVERGAAVNGVLGSGHVGVGVLAISTAAVAKAAVRSRTVAIIAAVIGTVAFGRTA